MIHRILIDSREFITDRVTGIGRFLEGFIDALADSALNIEIILTCFYKDSVPLRLRNRERIKIKEIPRGFVYSEKALSNLSRRKVSLFISPYPKLPLFGLHCPAAHTVHDVLDLRHPLYRKRIKTFFDILRVKRALQRAALTWYDSKWSMDETKRLTGSVGENPKVRYLGVDEKFNTEKAEDDNDILKRYDLETGYILLVGNGMPHKNLGVLLKIFDKVSKPLVFIGVPDKNQLYWRKHFPEAKGIWIKYVADEEMLPLIRGAFCLAQPSKEEGYGYPPLEAMACGVPAVVSNISVLVETTGANGLIADPNDPYAWIEAFKSLENKNTYQGQVEKGLKWVKPLQGQAGWKNHIADIKELLKGKK
jgi:glycosyltransferase involved in cell wall biosynthesis